MGLANFHRETTLKIKLVKYAVFFWVNLKIGNTNVRDKLRSLISFEVFFILSDTK